MTTVKQKPKEKPEDAAPALNEDGLVPGQEVSFADLMRIMSEQRNKEAE